MFRINEHFNGNVVSISFKTETLPATVGVMAAGNYKFDTNTKETITVVSGAFTVKLPGSKTWQIFNHGEQFIVEANQSFQLKVAVETAYLCTYSKKPRKIVLKKKTKKIISHENKRKHERYNVGHYPVEVKKLDGTILKAILHDMSYRGFQVMCTGLTSRMFSQETGILTDDDSNEVEITIKVKSAKKIEKVIADCRIVYIAKNDDIKGENSFVIGLQIIHFKGKSLAIIKQLIKKQKA
jgi:purine/pyrimidine-nucleoside phosphorylase